MKPLADDDGYVSTILATEVDSHSIERALFDADQRRQGKLREPMHVRFLAATGTRQSRTRTGKSERASPRGAVHRQDHREQIDEWPALAELDPHQESHL